ncbi:MAG: response regulator transcription factor [Verrucomicrobiota bacterium]
MSELSDPVYTIAVVEDDPTIRRSLEAMVRRRTGLQCVGAFGNGKDALQHLPDLKPKLILMDINLPDLSGVECVRQLAEKKIGAQMVMLTVYDDSDAVFASLSAGAIGYLLKPVKTSELWEAIEEVRAGGAPMSAKIARRVVQTFQKGVPAAVEAPILTEREQEVLEDLARGFQSKEIATNLGISYWTVETHVKHIYEKLHVRSRAEAVAKYRDR